MITPSVASKIIVGMLQGAMYIHEVWEKLPNKDQLQLGAEWERMISQNSEAAPAEIIKQIADHPQIGPAWKRLSDKARLSRSESIEVIIANTTG